MHRKRGDIKRNRERCSSFTLLKLLIEILSQPILVPTFRKPGGFLRARGMRPIDEKAEGRDKGECIGLCLNLQDRARGRISCYEAAASHRSVIHIPDVWRYPARRQENLHIASKRWTFVYPCAVALFGKESSVTRDSERLARISGWTIYVARERTTRGARYQR